MVDLEPPLGKPSAFLLERLRNLSTWGLTRAYCFGYPPGLLELNLALVLGFRSVPVFGLKHRLATVVPSFFARTPG